MIFGIFILVAIIGIIASLVIPGAGSSGGNRRSQSNFNNHTTTINPMLMDNQSQHQLNNNQPEHNYDSNGTSTDYNRANCDNSSSGSSDSGSSWSSDSGSSGGYDSGGGGSSDSGTNSSD
ncbi:hypothetical protein GC096_12165 [Paenibacillus sp. LMG 31461]|uniref:Uncharacterized protein n=1 Tax=Paenibacillus plantarum TaxID=2654975 RepID=A0ABX1X8K7_9BACL|nr:hypothetical protein [Paenibacillus plantarum]NOU64782.1 hypothetical protein [Paenibacillus plantarum]